MTHRNRDFLWFVAQLKPNSDRIALRNLERQGFETFLPRHEETRRARNRFVTRLQPLFPGYLFVLLDAAGSDWRAAKSTLGITRLIGTATRPTPVPAGLIGALRTRCGDGDRLIPASELHAGDQVRITGGPFADFVATIEHIDADRRIGLMLEIARRQVRVAVPADHVRPA